MTIDFPFSIPLGPVCDYWHEKLRDVSGRFARLATHLVLSRRYTSIVIDVNASIRLSIEGLRIRRLIIPPENAVIYDPVLTWNRSNYLSTMSFTESTYILVTHQPQTMTTHKGSPLSSFVLSLSLFTFLDGQASFSTIVVLSVSIPGT